MVFVCPLRIKLTFTHGASDLVQLCLPNLRFAITASSRSNAVLLLRISYDVAPMDHSMVRDGVSAQNNISFSLPSVAYTVEVLRPTYTDGFPQAMGAALDIIDALAVPERRFRPSKMTVYKHLLDVIWCIYRSDWNGHSKIEALPASKRRTCTKESKP